MFALWGYRLLGCLSTLLFFDTHLCFFVARTFVVPGRGFLSDGNKASERRTHYEVTNIAYVQKIRAYRVIVRTAHGSVREGPAGRQADIPVLCVSSKAYLSQL